MRSDFKRGSRYAISESGRVNQIWAYLGGSGGIGRQPVRASIHADEEGEPGLVLAATNAATIEAGDQPRWRTFTLPSPLELSPGEYWLTLHSGRETNVVEYYYDPTAGASRAAPDAFDDGPDALFADPVSATKDRQISIYATFDETPPATFGRTEIGSLRRGMQAGLKRGTRYNNAVPRPVNAVRAYLSGAEDTGSQAVSAAIYSDLGGEPAALLGATDALLVRGNDEPAWRDFHLKTPLLLPAGDYWLVLHSDGDDYVSEYFYEPVAGAMRQALDSFADGTDAVFGSADAVSTRDRQISIHATYLDTTPPSPPVAFTAVRNIPTAIDTVWTPASDDVGVAGYDLYVGGASVGSTTSISHTFAGLSCDREYTLTIQARDAAGNRSAPTALVARTAECDTYYVSSSTGSDSNDGLSPSTPWSSLARINEAALRPGVTVRLRRGDHWVGALGVTNSGTALQPIVLDAYGDGAKPLLTDPSAERCVQLNGDFVVARNLHVDNCRFGLAIFGNDARVERSIFSNNAEGVRVEPGSLRATVAYSEFYDNNRMVVNTIGGDDDYGAMGMLVGGDDAEVHHNIFSGHSAASYDYGRDGAAIEVFGGQRGRYHHNLSIDNVTFTELGNSRSAYNTYEYNVVRASIAGASFLETRGVGSFGPVYRTSASHNSVYLAGPSSPGIWCGNCGRDILKLRNNAINVTDGFALTGADEDYNILSGAYLNGTLGPHSRRADPLFVSRTDLRLQPASPAIDAGVDLGALVDFDGRSVPAGLAPDVGAYEHR